MNRRFLKTGVRWFVAVGCLSLCETGTCQDFSADGAAPHSELVQRLGDPSFTQRETATQELIELGSKAHAALVEGRRHFDPEIRFRCKRILAVIDYRMRERRFEAFVNAEADAEPLGGWDRFHRIVGDSKQTRSLFVEMHRSEWDLLESVQSSPKEVAEKYQRRCEYLRQASQSFRQPLSLGSVATVIFLAGEVDLEIGQFVSSTIYTFCYQNSFRTAIEGGTNKDNLRKLLGQWVSTNTSRTTAYQGLMLAMRYDLKEGLVPAKELLSQPGMPHHYKQYALLALAKLGSKEDLPLVEKNLDDKTPCSSMPIRQGDKKIVYQTQIRDVALAAAIHLHGQDLKKFGFERAQANSQMLYSTNTLGFLSDETRAAAREKWDQFRAREVKDGGEDDSADDVEKAADDETGAADGGG